jgi:hypothetical protein
MAIRFKSAPLEIPREAPFKYDLLEREPSATVLTQFVGRLNEPFVLAIDSPWGSGKTTFLKMWLQSLENQGFHCLYFNAWQNDFSDSPLVSLIGEIGEAIKKLKLGEEQATAARQAFEKAKRSGAALAKAALPAAIKLATAGLLDVSAIKAEDIAKLAEELTKQQIEKYEADKKTITHFRNELAELVSVLRQKSQDKTTRPIVFVIDELDRCRPPYAVELLEKIKHLFSVDGLIFVLAIDRQQLGESVRCLYGGGLDADNYLRRFIDLEYRLPTPEIEQFVKAQFARFGLERLSASGSKTRRSDEDERNLIVVLTKLFVLFGFHLRTQEQCFSQLAVVIQTTPATAHLSPFLLVPLLCLRLANHTLYEDYCTGRAFSGDVVRFIGGLKGGQQFLDTRLGALIEAYLIYGMIDPEQRDGEIEHVQQLAQSEKGDRTAIKRAQQVAECLRWPAEADDLTPYLYKKIELAQPFVDGS